MQVDETVLRVKRPPCPKCGAENPQKRGREGGLVKFACVKCKHPYKARDVPYLRIDSMQGRSFRESKADKARQRKRLDAIPNPTKLDYLYA